MTTNKGTIALFLVVIVLLIAVGTLGWMVRAKTQKITEETTLIDHLTDTVKVSRNNKGQLVAKISTLQTSSVNDFLKIKNLTGINKQLQDLVNQYKGKLGDQGSVTIISNDTGVDTTVKTASVIPKDTVKGKGDTVKLYPQYHTSISLGKWFTDDVTANKDSTTVKPKFHNEYEVVIGEENDPNTGWFKTNLFDKKRPFTEVTNLNPYTSNPLVKSYEVIDLTKPKKFGFGIQGGYGGQFFNKQINTGFYIGVGLTYNLFSF